MKSTGTRPDWNYMQFPAPSNGNFVLNGCNTTLNCVHVKGGVYDFDRHIKTTDYYRLRISKCVTSYT